MADPLGLDAIADLDWDRTQRRGYPEAVYCAEKTAEQVGLIAAAVAGRSELTTLFTRASRAARRGGAARAARRPATTPTPRLLAWPPDPPPPTGGLVAVAGGRHLRPAGRPRGVPDRPLPRPAETELVVDVGVAGLHRVLGRLDLLRRAGGRGGRGGHGRRAAQRGRRAGRRPGDRPAHLGRLRRLVRRGGRPAGDAQRLRPRGRRGQHRQRLRRRSPRGPDRRTGLGSRQSRVRQPAARLDRRLGRESPGTCCSGALLDAGADLAAVQQAVDAVVPRLRG